MIGADSRLIKRRMQDCYYQHLILNFRFFTQPRSAARLPSASDTVETETPPKKPPTEAEGIKCRLHDKTSRRDKLLFISHCD